MKAHLFAIAVALAACHAEPNAAPSATKTADFTPDDPNAGATVFLRGKPSGDQVVVDVVARGAADVQGTAFRLVFDPDVLAYADVARGPAFTSGALNVTKVVKPGELMAAWTEMGGTGFAANDETVLGTITFDVKARGRTTSVSFRGERSTLVDRRGKAAALTWRGGSFALK